MNAVDMNQAAPSFLALFWAGVIAFSILAYVVLDGLDLGVGILFGATRDPDLRGEMMGLIAPFWDGAETWLVVVGASLFAAFPSVYAIFLPAFYLPVLLLLIGLIFRGVAFEFRGRGGPSWLWSGGFWIGSALAAFVQGAAVGAMILGVQVKNGQFAGGPFDWLRPLPILTGIGLMFGYALLGAGWMILKSPTPLRDWAYERAPFLAIGMTLFLLLASLLTVIQAHDVMTRLIQRPWADAFVLVGLAALSGVLRAIAARRDALPFAFTALFFLAAFGFLAAAFWPYMIPYSVTVANAAAPEKSLSFLFWGAGIVVLPVVLIYSIVIHALFRGKLRVAGH
ncbi:cytochrome d ubiquinol oxidase subunit II [Rhodoblastus sp.]|uniref:cytochrome d ubiquinol oxidase subunit II n=1 Tax=Rhodoblastus sp. TaxID=1962975 RepID=UPI0026077F99|nr:cytochrome d ubiquinol oxidase subunit II [Rhodoblastus sp.]